MLGDLTRNIIPEYYESNFRNEDTFGRNEIVTEATKRHFASQVIEKTCGEDDIIMNIYGERFVAQMDKSNRFNLNVILGKLFHRDAPKIYVDDMFDMFEELVKVKYNLRGLFSIYLSAIESSVNPQYLQDDLSIKLNDGIKASYYEYSYSGLFSLASSFQNEDMPNAELLQRLLQDADSCPMCRPGEVMKLCKDILSDCRRNLIVEQIASRDIANALVQTAIDGFPMANDIQYTCFSSGALLLAPYHKTGAILGLVKYSGLPRLNDIIRAIATFNDDQVDSLPEGFVLYE